MAAKRMQVSDWIRKGLEEHGGDLLREMVAVFAQVLMSTDVDAVCGATYASRSSVAKLRGCGRATVNLSDR